MGKYGFKDNGIKVATLTADSIVNSNVTYGAIGTTSVEGTVAKSLEMTDENGSTFYMPLNRAA